MKNGPNPFLKTGIALLLFLSVATARAQYYYLDLLSAKQAQDEMASLKKNKVYGVDFISTEGDGSTSTGFVGRRTLSKDFRRSELFTRSEITGPSLLTTIFDESGRLVQSTDSSKSYVKHTRYFYDASGKVSSILNKVVSSDDDFTNELVEEHVYIYRDGTAPVKMYNVKNRKDTVVTLFATDENGRLAIEKNTASGTKYYYYYNDLGLPVQIAQADDMHREAYPAYLFQYDGSAQLVQMITMEEGGNHPDYSVWKYGYEDGLKSYDKIYSKERKLLGSVEYGYRKGK